MYVCMCINNIIWRMSSSSSYVCENINVAMASNNNMSICMYGSNNNGNNNNINNDNIS